MKNTLILIIVFLSIVLCHGQNVATERRASIDEIPIIPEGIYPKTPLTSFLTAYYRPDKNLYIFDADRNESCLTCGTSQTGNDGLSAYQIWLNEGNTGSEADFLNSLVGATGAQGIQGIQGPAGNDGADGATGPQGIPGNDGADGADGTNGTNGSDGVGVPAGGTTAQVLSKIDNTDFNTQWIDLPSSSGNKEYASFYLGTGGLTGQSNTTQTVVINNTTVNSNPSVFVLILNELIVNKTGDFEIDFGCYFNNSSTSRTEYTFWMEINNVEVPGSRSGNYQRGYDSGQSSDINMIVSINSGDVIRFRVNRTDGGSTTGYQDNNGTRLSIKEM